MSTSVRKLASVPEVGAQGASAGLTATQLGCILNDIAETAHAMQRIAVLLIHDDNGESRDSRDSIALTHGIMCMSQRVGLLSDIAAEGVPGSMGAFFSTSAEGWMMPPLYNDAAPERQGVQGGAQ